MLSVTPQLVDCRAFNSDTNIEASKAVTMFSDLLKQQQEYLSKIVPWFLENMPDEYFLDVPKDVQMQHLKAISTLEFVDQSALQFEMKSKEVNGKYRLTYITNSSEKGSLNKQLMKLVIPEGKTLSHVDIFTAKDNLLSLNVFTIKNIDSNDDNKLATGGDLDFVHDYLQTANDPSLYLGESYSRESLDNYKARIYKYYVQKLHHDPKEFLLHKKMVDEISGSDNCTVNIQAMSDTSYKITVASANSLPEVILKQTTAMLQSYDANIDAAHLYTIKDDTNILDNKIIILSMDCNFSSAIPVEKENVMKRDLSRAKWLDPLTTWLAFTDHPDLGVQRAEVITALCSLIHAPLFKERPQDFVSIRYIVDSVLSKPIYKVIVGDIADIFLEKFDVNNDNTLTDFEDKCKQIELQVSNLQAEGPKRALAKILEAVQKTKKTNFYCPNRYALSLRVDPTVMFPANTDFSQTKVPFGVFFVHGRHINAFHCRFKDIARGGLRLVSPATEDIHALESSRQFDEVYNLSYAQQLKNKDIPEGGSKGVILVNCTKLDQKYKKFALRAGVKKFTDAMLDLMVEDTKPYIKDYYGKDELIYFGPDEQVIPEDIEWITSRGATRGYPIPAALMSSKADAGFNHKEFGVTSEGVVVYFDVAMKHMGKDPKKNPFTVKITGGPDGDVAGNLMKFLIRDYGDNTKVVGIADGFGVAEDPDGLDNQELLRLVDEGLPITSFNTDKLGPNGIMLTGDNEEGNTRRNSMYYRVKADCFIPAGGRPNTMNSSNYKLFFDEETGKPSSPLIVEGANIFTTPEARKLLFEEGNVKIVKDSSANKCGVITSSFEIASSMLLTKQEFIDNKKELVEDVLTKLRSLARQEGELLFREFELYPGNLPHFSERISFAITKVSDAIADMLKDVGHDDELFKELQPLILEKLPEKIVELAGDKVFDNLPLEYQKNAIAKALAAKIVYKEGIHLVESQPYENIANRAVLYYRSEKDINDLISSMKKNGENAEAIHLLEKGGTRSRVQVF